VADPDKRLMLSPLHAQAIAGPQVLHRPGARAGIDQRAMGKTDHGRAKPRMWGRIVVLDNAAHGEIRPRRRHAIGKHQVIAVLVGAADRVVEIVIVVEIDVDHRHAVGGAAAGDLEGVVPDCLVIGAVDFGDLLPGAADLFLGADLLVRGVAVVVRRADVFAHVKVGRGAGPLPGAAVRGRQAIVVRRSIDRRLRPEDRVLISVVDRHRAVAFVSFQATICADKLFSN